MDEAIVNFKDYVVSDALSRVPGVTAKPMFGGYGLYRDGLIFGIILSSHELYFKVGDSNRADYEQAGSRQFSYQHTHTNKPTKMAYWLVPDEVLEHKETIAIWVKKALAVHGEK